ncbi:MAG: hypothetical protein M1831_003357 [Alyxoria varia]|nr:MAG: hypothetical protein M1831_003357 [Alyxoria varia]
MNTDKDTDNDLMKTPFIASEHARDGKYHLLLAASGSVATIKIPNIVQKLSKHANLSIRVIVTESSAKFLNGQSDEQPHLQSLTSLPNLDAIYRDEDEWNAPWVRGAPILHIELRRWADVMIVAPLSANTLAKLAGGICDNLLTSVVRAWQIEPIVQQSASSSEMPIDNPNQRKILVAPAMNTAMWQHPLTDMHLGVLRSFHWIQIFWPVEKALACGDTGDGAMHAWEDIVRVIEFHIEDQGIVRNDAS